MKYKVLFIIGIMMLIVGLTYATTTPNEEVYSGMEFNDYEITLDNFSSKRFVDMFSWFEEQDISFNIRHVVVSSLDNQKKYYFDSNKVVDVYEELVTNYIADLRDVDLDLSAKAAASGFIIRQVKVYTSKETIEAFVKDKLQNH